MDECTAQAKAMRMNNTENPSTAVTVNQILERYERDCMDELAPRTQRDYRRHIGHLKARFGHLVATELEPQIFAEFLDSKKKGKINRVRQLAVLSAAFRIAVRRWFCLKTNVLRDVERPKSKARDRLVLDHEFAGVRSSAPLRVKLMMDLAVIIGQRQGDLLNLKWTDIKEMELHVWQSKTGKRLAIEVSPDLERVLDQCWQLPKRGEYVITRRCGGRYTSEGFRALWQRTINQYVRRGGDRFTFHDLRALCATRCATPELAQRLLGHTSIGMTLRVYRRGVEHVKPVSLSAGV